MTSEELVILRRMADNATSRYEVLNRLSVIEDRLQELTTRRDNLITERDRLNTELDNDLALLKGL